MKTVTEHMLEAVQRLVTQALYVFLGVGSAVFGFAATMILGWPLPVFPVIGLAWGSVFYLALRRQ